MTARWYRIKPGEAEGIQWTPENLDAVITQLDEWGVEYDLELKRTSAGVQSAELSFVAVGGWAYPAFGDWIVRDPADEGKVRKVTAAKFTDKYEPKGTTEP